MSIRREQLHHLRQPGAAKNDQAHENGGAGIGLGTMPRKVRFRGQSGKHMLSWRFSGFDPISDVSGKAALRLDVAICVFARLQSQPFSQV
jgi:hypothetical protein